MPKRHRAVQPPYNRNVPTTTSLLDVADAAYKAGAMTWEDVQATQQSLMPDCAHCGLAHGGRILVEREPLCAACTAIEFERRKAARILAQLPQRG